MDVLPIQVTDAGVLIPRVYLQNADSFDVTVADDYVVIKSRRTNGATQPDFPPLDQYAAMQREQAAFRLMHPQLRQSYPNQYVAIHSAEVVDHDHDAYALTLRMRARFAKQPVLIQQVLETLDEIVVFRSPRLPQHAA